MHRNKPNIIYLTSTRLFVQQLVPTINKKYQRSTLVALCGENHQWPAGSPHKATVMWSFDKSVTLRTVFANQFGTFLLWIKNRYILLIVSCYVPVWMQWLWRGIGVYNDQNEPCHVHQITITNLLVYADEWCDEYLPILFICPIQNMKGS